jgi:hypothetical protein
LRGVVSVSSSDCSMRCASSEGSVSGNWMLGVMVPGATGNERTSALKPVKSGARLSLTLKVLAPMVWFEVKPSAELRSKLAAIWLPMRS